MADIVLIKTVMSIYFAPHPSPPNVRFSADLHVLLLDVELSSFVVSTINAGFSDLCFHQPWQACLPDFDLFIRDTTIICDNQDETLNYFSLARNNVFDLVSNFGFDVIHYPLQKHVAFLARNVTIPFRPLLPTPLVHFFTNKFFFHSSFMNLWFMNMFLNKLSESACTCNVYF